MLDLCVPAQVLKDPKILDTFVELGFKKIAISYTYKKGFTLPEPSTLPYKPGLALLRRLNFKLSDYRPGFKAELIAIEPADEKELEKALDLDCDIIMLKKLFCRRNVVNNAKQKGIMFELLYSSGYSLDGRKDLISMGNSILRLNNNLIISSGCSSKLDLRSPRDMLNMCALFQCNQEVARQIVVENSEQVVLKGQNRKVYRGMLAVENPNAPSNNKRKSIGSPPSQTKKLK